MALMLGQLYDALRAANVPDDKARAAAEEVANYEGELTRFCVATSELFREMDECLGRVKNDLRVIKWMTGFLLAFTLGTFALQCQVLLRLPS